MSAFELPLIDATRQLRITVRGRDSRGGVSNSPDNCALAVALRRTRYPEPLKVKVWYHALWVASGKHTTRYIPDFAAQLAIRIFDATGTMPPGSYNFLPPNGARTLQELRKRSAGPRKKPSGRRKRLRGSGEAGRHV